MSTVMYCWRIKKGDFWKAVHDLRQDALENHPAMDICAEIRERLLRQDPHFKTYDASEEYDKNVREWFQADETGLLALQIFDEGRTWLIRPLYCGMNFDESIRRINAPFREVFYDSRVGEGTRGAEEKADWVDAQVTGGKYFIHTILGAQEPFQSVVYNIWTTGFRKTRDSGP